MSPSLKPRAPARATEANVIAPGLAGLGMEALLTYLEGGLAVAQAVEPSTLPSERKDRWRTELETAAAALDELRKDHPATGVVASSRPRAFRADATTDKTNLIAAVDALAWLGLALADAGVTSESTSARVSTRAIWARRRA